MKEKKSVVILQYIILAIIALLFLIPLLWLAFASVDLNASPLLSLPKNPTIENYVSVITNPDNLRGFLNSFIIAIITSAVVVVFSFLAAYPLSRYDLKGKRYFLYIIIFMTSLPINAILVPVFKLFISFGLHDKLVSIAFFMAATNMPYGIWMMKNFMDSVPVSLEEAARVDGANSLVAMRHIIMPLMIPGILTVSIYVFTGAWGNFFVPFILLQTASNFPSSVRIYQFFDNSGLIEYGRLAAYSVVYMIPSVILYSFSQRFMSKGFALSGADKG
ncbi:MAG: carbohydrate ABC transporter permease [Clostridiaceae bacterium]|nr:carbohydrate ABC transporter permease [Clostridiaceae bacterium]